MKKLLIAYTASIFAAAPALAADAVVYEPAPAAAAAFDWSGMYIGAQVGYAWGESRYSNTDYNDFADYDPDGFFGGLYAGYNHQISNNLVLGIEGDINLTDIDGVTDFYWNGDSPDPFASSKIEYSGAIRARLGYAVGRFMPYVGGGLSVAKYEFDLFLNDSLEFEEKKTLVGWNIGLGVEYAATQKLLLRAEYRYSDFGSKHFSQDWDSVEDARVDLSTNDIRLGIAYKF